MKKSIIFIFIISFFLTSSANSKQAISEEEYLLTAHIQILSNYHFLKKKPSTTLFNEIFVNYLKELDRFKFLLLENEVRALAEYRQPNKDNLSDILEISSVTKIILDERIAELRMLVAGILQQEFDFAIDETYETDYKKVAYASSLEDLKDRWRRRLKYRMLEGILEKTLPDTSLQLAQTPRNKQQDSKQDLSKIGIGYAEAKEKTRTELVKSFQRYFANIQTQRERDYFNLYLKALSKSYDEYTSFLPPIEKETFDIDMSGQLEGIGAEITKNEIGYIEIVRIVPGGPSYQQKELQSGDQIMKVAQGYHEAVDIKNFTLNEALKLIRGKKGTLIQLTVKKANGSTKVIPIIRDTIVLNKTYARSVVLQFHNKRYGYLYLPKFYRDFNNKSSSRSSSEDVHKELTYLNSQNVDALVFDLRFNGGGSLEDAIVMSGLFIKDGPVIRVRDSEKEYPAYRDKDSGIAFDKPMLVLVNEGSASASEILAASLQDHKRALIVGSSQKTFGKGTVQILHSLNNSRYAKDNYNGDLGYLKFTTQKYYRISGLSTQTIGVKPDIVIPSLENFQIPRESSYSNDSLSPIPYSKWDKFQYNYSRLEQKQQLRLQNNSNFENIIKRNKLMLERKKQTKFTLNHKQAHSSRQAYLKELVNYVVDLQQDLDFKAIPKQVSEADKQPSGFKEKIEERNSWYNQLSRDIYIRETLAILEDVLEDI